MTEMFIGPITQDWVNAYAHVSGDDNPLHIRQDGPTIVHGALLAALAERFVRHVLPSIEILSFRCRFVRPVPVGSGVVFRLGVQRQIVEQELTAIEQKVLLFVPGNRLAMLGECRYLPKP